MKRLLSVIVCIVLNVFGVDISQGRPLDFNNFPHNFGTTHFIVGYNAPKKEDKKPQSILRKKQSALLNGASLIDKNRLSQSFFTTIHDLSPILLEVMSQPTKRLYVAAFTLTDSRLMDSIINAHQNGTDVRIITDAGNMRQMHSKIPKLIDNNIPVWSYKFGLNPNHKKNGLSAPLMHHKFIIGDDFVVTGSANFTKAGQRNNMENINILRDKEIIGEYFAEFNRLIKFCVKGEPEARA